MGLENPIIASHIQTILVFLGVIMISEYNRKFVGKYGEMFKYSEDLLGVYTDSKRIAKKLAGIKGAIKRQDGDFETVFSVPENEVTSVLSILKISGWASWKKD